MSHDSAPAAKRSRHTLNERNFENDNDLSFSNATPRRNHAVNQLLNRPLLVDRPETEEINMTTVSETLKQKNIQPSKMSFGFLGLGIMGSGIVKNLIDSGHNVAIWNRTGEKCRKFEEAGATVHLTPSDVIDNVDITFSCVSDPTVAKQVRSVLNSDFFDSRSNSSTTLNSITDLFSIEYLPLFDAMRDLDGLW